MYILHMLRLTLHRKFVLYKTKKGRKEVKKNEYAEILIFFYINIPSKVAKLHTFVNSARLSGK